MQIFPFPSYIANVEKVDDIKSFVGECKSRFNEYQEAELYQVHPKAAFYIYRIKKKKNKYFGIIATIDIEDYIEGNIKKHENTIRSKEEKTCRILEERGFSVKPVLLTYRKRKGLKRYLKNFTKRNKPILELKIGKEKHKAWRIDNPQEVKEIRQNFELIPTFYVGDGHHRLVAFAKLYQEGKEQYRYLMAGILDMSQIEILDYNRLVKVKQSDSGSTFLDELERLADIKKLSKARKPKKSHELTMYLEGNWYKLRWKKALLEKLNAGEAVDAKILNKYVFEKLLGIEDIRTDQRIEYIGAKKSLKAFKKAVDEETNMGFLFYPMRKKDFLEIVDMGYCLPPKSTWFLPRLPSGLIVKEI